MKHLLFFFLFAFVSIGEAQSQDSLARYSLSKLDSLYKSKKTAKEQLPYALALVKKGKEELDPQDTTYANYLFELSVLYIYLRDYAPAVPILQQVVDIRAQKTPQEAAYASSLYNLGITYFYQGQYEKVEPLWLKALEIRQIKLGEKHPEYVRNISLLGLLYKTMGRYALAESYYLKSLELRKVLFGENHADYAASLGGLGSVYMETGNYALAESFQLQGLKIQKEVLGEQHVEYAASLNDLAILYRQMGNYAAAEPLFQEALRLRKATLGDLHPNYAASLNNLAGLYDDRGSYELEEPLLLEAMRIRKATLGEQHPNYAASLNNLGLFYKNRGKDSLAEPLLQEAMRLRKAALGERHPLYAGSLNNLASFYQKIQRYDLAEPLFQEALRIRKAALGEKHPEYAAGIHSLASLYEGMGNYPSAESLYLEALNLRKAILGEQHRDYLQSLEAMGHVYTAMANDAAAQSYYAQFLPLQLNYLDFQAGALGEKAKQDLFKLSIPSFHRLHFFAAFHSQHDSLFALLQDGLLLTKGYALAGVSELLPLIKSLKDSTLNETYNAWMYTKKQLGKAHEMSLAERRDKGVDIDSLQRLVVEQEAILMQRSASLKERLGYHKKRFYYKDLVAQVDKDEVAIDFVRFENEKRDTAWYYALVTQSGAVYPQYIPLCTEAQLQGYADADISPQQENYITKKEWNRAVYALLIQPLEPYLQKKKRIHWAPVALMNRIALGTLQDKKGKLLGERFELHQYGSLKDFILKKQVDGNTGSIEKSVLLVGDVAFDLEESEHKNLAQTSVSMELYASRSMGSDSTRGATRFSRLAGTKVEVENLNQAFAAKKWKILQLQQKEALEEKVLEYTGSNTPLVLHFATHGFFLPTKKQGTDNPLLRSGIALAGANRVWMGKAQIEGVEDGLWTAYEIANLDLHRADLVVLSACETARGQIDPNEGVLGLQRAFKIAGVDNMILSLWQVPDKETVELMQAFYTYYLKGEIPSVALRKAQADMRKKYPDPYYWAAFILIE